MAVAEEPEVSSTLSLGAAATTLSGLWKLRRSSLSGANLAFSAVSVNLPKLDAKVASTVQSDKSLNRHSQHVSTHNGIHLVSTERRKALLSTLEDGLQYTDAFKACCRRKYGNMVRAWRLLLDPGGNGRVSFVPFCNSARAMGFVNVSTLWRHLDVKSGGFITLDSWDPAAYRVLMEFREICRAEFGGMNEAFRFGMNKNGSGTCYRPEFHKFLSDFEFSGDPQTLWDALDKDRGGFITVDELHFLSRWEGMRFRSDKVERDFNLGLARLKICKQQRQMHQQRMCEFKARVADDKLALERNRSKRATTVKQSVLLQQDAQLQSPPPEESEQVAREADSDGELDVSGDWIFRTGDCDI
ncbi:unnamed protein product [Effrenium voratum]|uniref:EF-hand domain-containing protein n=1 Tax=Effrenium voratum TaxID=2562239 RepID=A0AA36J5F7_9DINO|nr:unnamed protein product [Effrenium voratum]